MTAERRLVLYQSGPTCLNIGTGTTYGRLDLDHRCGANFPDLYTTISVLQYADRPLTPQFWLRRPNDDIRICSCHGTAAVNAIRLVPILVRIILWVFGLKAIVLTFTGYSNLV